MKSHVLIVEDEDIVAADIQEALESFQYEICGRAASGDQAISLAYEKKPDLILMDIKLQGDKDGINTAEIIKNELNIPIIYLTAYTDNKTFTRAKITEPYGYILKPFKELELKMAVELALHKHKIARNVIQETPQSDHNIVLSEESEKIFNILNKVVPFSEGSKIALKKLAQVARFSNYKAGEAILFEGDDVVSGFVVVSGRIALVKASSCGKDLIVELLPPGDPYGLLATFDKPNSPVTVTAQIESTVIWVPRSEVLLFLDRHAELNKRFLREVFDRLRRSHDFSRALAHDRVEVRIAHALNSLLPKFSAANSDKEIPTIKMSRQQMADFVGATQETVIRAMKTMEKDNLLDLSETGFVKVLNTTSIKTLAES